jgi:pilus assembly protein Flp/PilA
MPGTFFEEEINVKDTMLKLYLKIESLLSQDEGQDLIEYALLVAIVSLSATAAMENVARTVSTFYTNIASGVSGAIPAGS